MNTEMHAMAEQAAEEHRRAEEMRSELLGLQQEAGRIQAPAGRPMIAEDAAYRAGRQAELAKCHELLKAARGILDMSGATELSNLLERFALLRSAVAKFDSEPAEDQTTSQ